MTVSRGQLFAELDKLRADEIEAGLDAGVWSGDRRQLVEQYLDQMKLTTLQMDIADTAKGRSTNGRRSVEEGNLNSNGGLDHRRWRDDRCSGVGLRRVPRSTELDLVIGSELQQGNA